MRLVFLIMPTQSRGKPYNSKRAQDAVLTQLHEDGLITDLTVHTLYLRSCNVDPLNLRNVERELQRRSVPYRKEPEGEITGWLYQPPCTVCGVKHRTHEQRLQCVGVQA
jgi:hypothetical protein